MSTSRFEHSLGVMAIVNLIGGDESSQISALLHDLSHTVFSHVGDLVLGYKYQDYHTKVYQQFVSTDEVQRVLKYCKISRNEIEFASNPLFQEDLNPDRLDYAIRDLLRSNGINQSEYTAIINNIVIDKDGKIVFS